MRVADELKAGRERAGITQSQLARRAGTSQATLSAYETGRKQPSVATLSRLLAATGSRLLAQPGHPPVIEPSPAQHARLAESLLEVIELAEALPVRHEKMLRFPRLDVAVQAA